MSPVHSAAHSQARTAPAPRTRHAASLTVGWARDAETIRAAQRLRYRVFAEEMGARLQTPIPGHDIDVFDAWCEHLVVRDAALGEVVATYRVLTPEGAHGAGCLYSETEFDLTRLRALRPRLLELGRSCVAAEHRSGGSILLLWAALAETMRARGYEYLVGCASVPMHDGGHAAASLWRSLRASHLAAPEFHVRPLLPLPVEELDGSVEAHVPPLLRAYLRAGAQVIGAPAWDPDFRCADLPLLLKLSDLSSRHRRHFMGVHAS